TAMTVFAATATVTAFVTATAI
ncbi:hypothetical protein A2U01_0056635, partial [Trifolium medium]|nr:hypothetical protein [Trifolium medium]